MLSQENEHKSTIARRSVDKFSTNESVGVKDIREVIRKYVTSIIVGSVCLAPGKVCVAGPPGPKGVHGPPGKRGARGTRERKGIMGPPGEPGKQGMMGDDGAPGLKGEKGMIGWINGVKVSMKLLRGIPFLTTID